MQASACSLLLPRMSVFWGSQDCRGGGACPPWALSLPSVSCQDGRRAAGLAPGDLAWPQRCGCKQAPVLYCSRLPFGWDS